MSAHEVMGVRKTKNSLCYYENYDFSVSSSEGSWRAALRTAGMHSNVFQKSIGVLDVCSG